MNDMKVTTEEMAKVATGRNTISTHYESEKTLVENLIASYKEAHPDCSKEKLEIVRKEIGVRNSILCEFVSWAKSNLDKILSTTAVSAFSSILKETLHSGLENDYVRQSKGSLFELELATRRLIEGISVEQSFKAKANESFVSVAETSIKAKLTVIIKKEYNKDVEIVESFITPGNFFADVIASTDYLHDLIAHLADNIFNNIFESDKDLNWNMPRSIEGRRTMVDSLLKSIEYNSFEHNIDIDELISHVEEKIDKILIENGLFQVCE